MAQPFDPNNLSDRARDLLRALVAQYIEEGAPVGSRTLAKHSGLDVSPATIRNVMSDLEEIGLITAPHTSAGRIPTQQGYRLFVDSLLHMRPLSMKEVRHIARQLPPELGTKGLAHQASELLSALTHFVGVVTVPKREEFAFKHIDFVPVGERRVLVIVVFADNEVQNRIIDLPRTYEPSELERIANYLNEQFTGMSLSMIRQTLLQDIQATNNAMQQLLQKAAEMASFAFGQGQSTGDMLMAGQTQLMGVQELSDIQRLRDLFDAFTRKNELLDLLQSCEQASGVRVFIGDESGFSPLGDCAVVSAPYGNEDRTLGVLAVIGPTRMAYDRIIPVVEATANVLGQALNHVR